jgi:hypothetical protein
MTDMIETRRIRATVIVTFRGDDSYGRVYGRLKRDLSDVCDVELHLTTTHDPEILLFCDNSHWAEVIRDKVDLMVAFHR